MEGKREAKRIHSKISHHLAAIHQPELLESSNNGEEEKKPKRDKNSEEYKECNWLKRRRKLVERKKRSRNPMQAMLSKIDKYGQTFVVFL